MSVGDSAVECRLDNLEAGRKPAGRRTEEPPGPQATD